MAKRNSSGESLPVQAESEHQGKNEAYKMKSLCKHEYKQAALKQGNNFFSGWVCAKCGKLAGKPRHVVGYDSSETQDTGDN